LVADILDHDRMEFIFARYQPEIVFHAAAHKHVYLMERQPAEAIRNNVLGTRQLAQIAARHGVEAFTLISTDKAINPTNVMGATKRLAEIQLMAVAAQQPDSPLRSEVRGQRPEVSSVSTSNDKKVIGFKVAAEPTTAAVAKSTSTTGVQESTTARAEPAKILSSAALTSDFRPLTSGSVAAGRAPAPEFAEALSSKPLTSDLRPLTSGTKFMAVRFGNVLGSSGSVIPIFKRQIANGGPVTVTHPDVTRYFMTIPEAVGLVLQSFVQGKGGEIFVLDMGQPVKIVDLAKQMIELSGFRVGDDIEITFTGLKPGEKLFEELQHHTEEYAPTEHPRIMRFTSSAMFSESGVSELEKNLYHYDSNQLKAILKQLVPEYTPFLD
jgi:FlaA1/EpsC-like NDP-sugar epimerase